MIKDSWGILCHYPGEPAQCTLCPSNNLTFEHIPPRSSCNDTPARDWVQDGTFANHRGLTKLRKGLGKYSLCEDCNNNIGSRYAKHFKSWTQQALELVQQSNGYEYASRNFAIRPYYIAKQLALMAVAMGHEDYKDKPWFQNIQSIASNENEHVRPTEFTFWSYLVSTDHVRLAGISTYASRGYFQNPLVYCEIARRPLGYVIFWDSAVSRIFAKSTGMVCLDRFFDIPDKIELNYKLKMRKLRPKSFAALEYEGVTSSIDHWR